MIITSSSHAVSKIMDIRSKRFLSPKNFKQRSWNKVQFRQNVILYTFWNKEYNSIGFPAQNKQNCGLWKSCTYIRYHKVHQFIGRKNEINIHSEKIGLFELGCGTDTIFLQNIHPCLLNLWRPDYLATILRFVIT